jgi:aspartate aminotransferase
LKYADRLSLLGSETAFELLAKAKKLEAEGHNVIHMEIGEPDFITPKNIIDAGIKALLEGHTHYTGSAGDFKNRSLYADYLNKRYGCKLDGENIIITPGAKPVIFLSALAVINPGDEVIYPDPGYPIYRSVVNFLEGVHKPYFLREESGFRFDPEEVKNLVSPKTKLLILNSPHNPTGGVLTREDLELVIDLAMKHDFWILSDEIYSRILYGREHVGVMNFPEAFDRIILLDGHSKTYAMTGWRLGYACVNKELAKHFTTLMTNANSCTAAFTQIAGVEALHGDQSAVEGMVEEFKARRDLIVDEMNKLPGVTCHKPDGAFYVFPNFKSYGKKSSELQQLFLEGGVAALAGTAFGPGGEGYMRFSYATSKENIREGLSRVAKILADIK